MAGDDDREQGVRPSEQRGGANPTDAEAREKGEWVETAKEGTSVGVEKPVHPARDDPGSSGLRRDTGSVRAPK